VNLYYSPAYVGSGYAFETTRKSKWVADSLGDTPIANITLLAPQPLSREQVAAVHDPHYVSAVQTGSPLALAQSQGFSWDAGLWAMLLSSNGGAVAAALDALRSGLAGSLSSGLHHARSGAGKGYCTFNGLVIAARAALAAGAQSVLILDLDAHCGGGTASLIGAEPRIWQLDVSVDDYDSYESIDRIRLQMVQSSDAYLSQIKSSLLEMAGRGPHFDLCLYNAGMDPFEGCPDGGLAGITKTLLAEREEIVFDWCCQQGLPVAFSLAGGYIGPKLDQQGLVDLHRLTLSAAAQSDLLRHGR
jgi:acetoin utilization deacetylase AcuC-like enzyme